MATTIKAYAHKDLASFVGAVIAAAAKGDFFDALKWPRSYYGNRPYSPFPNTDLVSGGAKPADSGFIAASGDTLYAAGAVPVQRFGQFINDVQVAAAAGGKFNGKTVESLILTDHTTKPYFRCNILFGTGAVPVAKKTIAAKADITGKVGGSTTNFATMFTVSTNPAATAADFDFTVTPTTAGTVSAAGVLTLADTATGTVSVKATAKVAGDFETGKSEATVKFTGVTAKPATPTKTVTGKGNITGKKQGEVIPASDLFAYAGGATIADVASVTVTPATGAAAWDNTAKTLTIDDAAVVGDDINVDFTTAAGVTKAGTIVIKSVAAK